MGWEQFKLLLEFSWTTKSNLPDTLWDDGVGAKYKK